MPRRAAKPSIESGQGALLAIAVRRARRAAAARVSSWVGLRTSMPASCSTRSPISTQMTVEDQGPHRFGHVAAGLPAGG